jgi:hypothetical protein
MLNNCLMHGITPLTREEFEREDKRMLVELARRRNGLDDARTPTLIPKYYPRAFLNIYS